MTAGGALDWAKLWNCFILIWSFYFCCNYCAPLQMFEIISLWHDFGPVIKTWKYWCCSYTILVFLIICKCIANDCCHQCLLVNIARRFEAGQTQFIASSMCTICTNCLTMSCLLFIQTDREQWYLSFFNKWFCPGTHHSPLLINWVDAFPIYCWWCV